MCPVPPPVAVVFVPLAVLLRLLVIPTNSSLSSVSLSRPFALVLRPIVRWYVCFPLAKLILTALRTVWLPLYRVIKLLLSRLPITVISRLRSAYIGWLVRRVGRLLYVYIPPAIRRFLISVLLVILFTKV